MKIKRGSTSVRRLIFIADTSKTDGSGLANLVYNSSGLTAYYFAGDLSAAVQITLAAATLGTWASGGFIAVDNTNMPGWYEIGIPNAALDGGNEVAIQFKGATNMAPVNLYISLDSVDYQDAAAFGLSRLDAAVSSRMATYTQPTGFLAATFPAVVSSYAGGAVASVTVPVTVGTNNDKTGYSLATTPPTAGQIADAVWDEPHADHTTDGTYGDSVLIGANSNRTVQVTGSNHVAADIHELQAGVITAADFSPDWFTAAGIASDAVTEIQSGLATAANQVILIDRVSYALTALVGACSDAQTAAETYTLSIGGNTYTLDYSGLDASGNRSTTTLTKA